MIIKQNNYNYSIQYKKLFEDAYKLLRESDKIKDTDKPTEPFTCLEEYFMYLDLIAKLHAEQVRSAKTATGEEKNARFAVYSKYLMLPLDEEYFTINADTRVISIPTIFARNGVSLTGDQRAETLLFEIDRYFDYMDLIRAQIQVQWTSPGGVDGTSEISLVDYDSKKIRFGWTLSSDVIDAVGNLKFSVRFFMKNEGGNVIYSLNTIPVSVVVKAGLRVEIGESTYIDDDIAFFANAIKRGANSGAETFPENPIIYMNLPTAKQYMADDNTLTFDIAAYSADTGEISYKWVKTPYDNTQVSETLIDSADNISVGVIYIKTEDTDYVDNKPYYVKTGNVYELVDPKEPFNSDTYLEQVSRCKIESSTDPVAGSYQVVVTNTVSKNSTNIWSNKCEVPAPKTITYTKDLNVAGKANLLPEDGSGLTLSVTTTSDDSEAKGQYKWFKKVKETDDFAPIADYSDSNILSVTEPGWYYVNTQYTLNRASIDKACDVIAKITNKASAPGIKNYTGEDQVVRIEGDSVEIVVQGYVDNGETDIKLMSDGLIYTWYCSVADDPDTTKKLVVIGEDGVMNVSVDENGYGILKVQKSNETESFWCEVTNTINGDTATTASDLYIVLK